MELFDITTQQERSRTLPLFYGIEDSLLDTFLEGVDGLGWCDDLAYPRLAAITVKDFLYIGGNPELPEAAEFAGFLPPPEASANKEWTVIPCDEDWVPLIEEAHKDKVSSYKRYAMKRTLKGFDRDKLRQFTKELPEGYTLLGMDEEVFEMATAEDWSRDFVSSFKDADDFVERGIGFCILKDDKLVAGASSFTVFSDGIEVQIQTHDDHQRKGLARACGAALVLACLSQKRIPCWDACSIASCKLAQQLGYQVDRAYTAINVKR